MTYKIKGLRVLFPTPPRLPHLDFGVESYDYFTEVCLSRDFGEDEFADSNRLIADFIGSSPIWVAE